MSNPNHNSLLLKRNLFYLESFLTTCTRVMRGMNLDRRARSDLIKGSSDVGSVSLLDAFQLFGMKYFCQSPPSAAPYLEVFLPICEVISLSYSCVANHQPRQK